MRLPTVISPVRPMQPSIRDDPGDPTRPTLPECREMAGTENGADNGEWCLL